MGSFRLFCVLIASCLLTGPAAMAEDYDEESFFEDNTEEPRESSEEPQTPMLGVQMANLPRSVQRQQNLSEDGGVYVFRVYDDTAAQELGIKPGDVITEINGQSVGSMQDLRDVVIGQSQSGEEVSVGIRRDGEDQQLGGATFKPWPDHIPMSDLPSRRNHARHRAHREARRNARQLRQLAREQAALEGQLADRTGGLGDFGLMQERLGELGADPLLPGMLLALPGWRFDYRITVADPGDDAAASPAQPGSSPELDARRAAAPRLRIDYHAHASSAAL